MDSNIGKLNFEFVKQVQNEKYLTYNSGTDISISDNLYELCCSIQRNLADSENIDRIQLNNSVGNIRDALELFANFVFTSFIPTDVRADRIDLKAKLEHEDFTKLMRIAKDDTRLNALRQITNDTKHQGLYNLPTDVLRLTVPSLVNAFYDVLKSFCDRIDDESFIQESDKLLHDYEITGKIIFDVGKDKWNNTIVRARIEKPNFPISASKREWINTLSGKVIPSFNLKIDNRDIGKTYECVVRLADGGNAIREQIIITSDMLASSVRRNSDKRDDIDLIPPATKCDEQCQLSDAVEETAQVDIVSQGKTNQESFDNINPNEKARSHSEEIGKATSSIKRTALTSVDSRVRKNRKTITTGWANVKSIISIVEGGRIGRVLLHDDGSIEQCGQTGLNVYYCEGKPINSISHRQFRGFLGIYTTGKAFATADFSVVHYKYVPRKMCKEIKAGEAHVLLLRQDGTLGANCSVDVGQCAIDSWTNISTIECGEFFSVGVRSDGKVLLVGSYYSRELGEYKNISGLTDDWTDIVSVVCTEDYIIGIQSAGTLVMKSVSDNRCESLEQALLSWDQIKKISIRDNTALGVKKDGTVITNDNRADLSQWVGIKDVYCGIEHYFGICNDGSVICQRIGFGSQIYNNEKIYTNGRALMI